MANFDASAGAGSGLTRSVRELTQLIHGLQASELEATDRAALRSLLDELERFVHTATSQTTRASDHNLRRLG